MHAALESSEEAVGENFAGTSPAAANETTEKAGKSEEKTPEVKTDTYNKLLVENKKILCELNLKANPSSSSKKQTITAYTEEQLAALYHNSELELVDDFITHFVEAELKGVATKQHPLYELLTNYLRVREKITGNTLEFNQLRKEYHECRLNLWTIEKGVISKPGQCQDGVRVSARQDYDKALFHKSAFQTLVRILDNVQELTNQKHVLYTFSAEDLKLQVHIAKYIEIKLHFNFYFKNFR